MIRQQTVCEHLERNTADNQGRLQRRRVDSHGFGRAANDEPVLLAAGLATKLNGEKCIVAKAILRSPSKDASRMSRPFIGSSPR